MRRLLCLLLAALLTALTACGGQTASHGPVVYYGANAQEGYDSAAIQGEVWEDAPEDVTIDDLMARMLTEPEDPALYVVFPAGVHLLSWTLEDGLLSLDFSESYSELSGISLTLANYCLVMTAAQLEGVQQVAVTVEGHALSEGSQGPFSTYDILLTGEIQDPDTVGFPLWFPLLDRSGLGTEYREAELYSDSLENRVDAVIQLLAAGPGTQEELDDPFTGLEAHLDCTIMDQVCVLTLTEDWAELLSRDELACQALVNSLCALSGVDSVMFSWNGEGAEQLAGMFQAEG